MYILFIYLFGRKRERVSGEEAEGKGQTDSALSSEPDLGLSPRTLLS